MKPGSVLVDIAIDQGGCFEDSRPTTHAEPTFPVHGSVFYCVANMPGAVPYTSTYALTNVTLPYALSLADQGWRDALRADPALGLGLNTHDGAITYAPVAEAHGLPHRELAEVLWPERGFDAVHWSPAVQGYLDHLVVERGLSAHTIGGLPPRPAAATPTTCAERGVTEPAAVTATMINEYAMRLREGVPAPRREGWVERPLGPASVARAVVAVRSLHRFAARRGDHRR